MATLGKSEESQNQHLKLPPTTNQKNTKTSGNEQKTEKRRKSIMPPKSCFVKIHKIGKYLCCGDKSLKS